jgi:hypothetical protein
MSTDRAQRVAAYQLLNKAIDELAGPVAPGIQIATDAILIVGCQGYDEEGHRIGSAGIFVKDGSQPMWITRNLVREAMYVLEPPDSACHCETCTCESDE